MKYIVNTRFSPVCLNRQIRAIFILFLKGEKDENYYAVYFDWVYLWTK